MLGKIFVKFKKFRLPTLLLVGILLVFNCGLSAFAMPLPKTESMLTIYAMGKTYKFFYPEIDFCGNVLYLKNAEQIVDGIYLDTLIKPQDATAEIYPDREYPFEFKNEKYGKAIDKQDLLTKINRALILGEQSVRASEMVITPKYMVEELQKSTYRRAFFTTHFPYSSSERKQNIALCAKYIGGKTILPYESFSFNEVVGERTEDRGFLNAKVIENGKFIDGVGGGVCQVSSTLYNAVLLSGLKITERHPHSMLVSYVEPSFDAMVSSNYADLKFVNDTNSVIFLIVKATDSSVTAEIYGTKSAFEYKRVSKVSEIINPPEPDKKESDLIDFGQEKFIVFPKDGAVSEGFLEVYKSGKLVNIIQLSKDKYKPLQGTIIFGKKE